jgi:hypothetical protein
MVGYLMEIYSDGAGESAKGEKMRHSILHRFVYVLVMRCLLVGIGMQLSLLFIATSLGMMNRRTGVLIKLLRLRFGFYRC